MIISMIKDHANNLRIVNFGVPNFFITDSLYEIFVLHEFAKSQKSRKARTPCIYIFGSSRKDTMRKYLCSLLVLIR